jgi:hypothetical protein
VNAPTHQIAVIRARLPYTDARALSQAWFSALRLASDGHAPELRRGRARTSAALSGDRAATPSRETGARPLPAATPRAHGAALRRGAGAPSVDATARRRFREGVVARDGVRTTTDARAAFTVTLANARVRLLVRGDGDRLHVVALCSARLADTVARALALASVSLRQRGPIATAIRVTGYAS